MKPRRTVECPACRYAWQIPEAGCSNPWCKGQANLTPERETAIEEAIQRVERDRLAREHRQRMAARSYTNQQGE